MFNKDLKLLKQLPEKISRIIAVDTETTGGQNEDNHILEIAAIEIINGKLTGKIFHGYIKPRRKINFMAMQVHKMNENFFKENFEGFYESDKNVMQSFLDFVKDDFVFAHNAQFDSDFINYELKFWGLKQIAFNKFRCSCAAFQSLFKNSFFADRLKGFSLGKCCEFFKINVNKEGLHSGLYDAMLLAKLICCIYLFLDKNPDYLSKREVVNMSQFNKVLFKEEFKKKLMQNQANQANNNVKNVEKENYDFISKANKDKHTELAARLDKENLGKENVNNFNSYDENQNSNSNNSFKNAENAQLIEKNSINNFFNVKKTSENKNNNNNSSNNNLKQIKDNKKFNNNNKKLTANLNNKKVRDKTNKQIDSSFFAKTNNFNKNCNLNKNANIEHNVEDNDKNQDTNILDMISFDPFETNLENKADEIQDEIGLKGKIKLNTTINENQICLIDSKEKLIQNNLLNRNNENNNENNNKNNDNNQNQQTIINVNNVSNTVINNYFIEANKIENFDNLDLLMYNSSNKKESNHIKIDWKIASKKNTSFLITNIIKPANSKNSFIVESSKNKKINDDKSVFLSKNNPIEALTKRNFIKGNYDF